MKEPMAIGTEFGRERFELRTLFEAKIAAAYLYATKGDIAAIVASLRAEEHAMVNALAKRRQSRTRISAKWPDAAHAATAKGGGRLPRRIRRQSLRRRPAPKGKEY